MGRLGGSVVEHLPSPFFFFFKDFILFIHERRREAETQAEGEVGSLLGT